MNAHAQIKTPVSIAFDATLDVTDRYHEADQDAADYGVEAALLFTARTAEFDRSANPADGTVWGTDYSIVGLMTDDGHGPQFHTVEQAKVMLDADNAWLGEMEQKVREETE